MPSYPNTQQPKCFVLLPPIDATMCEVNYSSPKRDDGFYILVMLLIQVGIPMCTILACTVKVCYRLAHDKVSLPRLEIKRCCQALVACAISLAMYMPYISFNLTVTTGGKLSTAAHFAARWLVYAVCVLPFLLHVLTHRAGGQRKLSHSDEPRAETASELFDYEVTVTS